MSRTFDKSYWEYGGHLGVQCVYSLTMIVKLGLLVTDKK